MKIVYREQVVNEETFEPAIRITFEFPIERLKDAAAKVGSEEAFKVVMASVEGLLRNEFNVPTVAKNDVPNSTK